MWHCEAVRTAAPHTRRHLAAIAIACLLARERASTDIEVIPLQNAVASVRVPVGASSRVAVSTRSASTAGSCRSVSVRSEIV